MLAEDVVAAHYRAERVESMMTILRLSGGVLIVDERGPRVVDERPEEAQ